MLHRRFWTAFVNSLFSGSADDGHHSRRRVQKNGNALRRNAGRKSRMQVTDVLEDRTVLTPLTGIDFGGGAVPTNWSGYSGSSNSTLTNLINEDGVATGFSAVITRDSIPGGPSNFTPQPSTLPQHTQSLAGIDRIYQDQFGNIQLNWGGLTPGASYEVYVFGGNESAGNPRVTITGATEIPFGQSHQANQLMVNDQLGDSSRTLSSYAKIMNANAGGNILVRVDSVFQSFFGTAGMAIRPAAASPGFTVTPISGNTTEAGGTATFSVKLNTQPTADVTISLSSNDTTEGTVTQSSLTFNGANWNTPQVVTVTGVDDTIDDGDILYRIVTSAATSTDLDYNGLNPNDVTLINSDNDAPLLITSATSVSIAEGSTNTFTVRLSIQPFADVIVNVARSSGDTNLSVSSGAALTFTTLNWNTPQTVTLAAAEDADIVNGTAVMSITSAGLTTVGVTASEVDNDSASLTADILKTSFSEGFGITDILVTRNSGTSAPLTVTLINSNPSAAELSQTTITIPAGQSSAIASLKGAEDLFVDGTQTVTITANAVGHLSGTDTVEVTDNDSGVVSTAEVVDSDFFSSADGTFNPFSSLGVKIWDEQWLSHRFFVPAAVTLSSVGGYFQTFSPVPVTAFVAITALSSESDVPDSATLSTPDVLQSTTITVPAQFTGGDISAPLSMVLSAGWYSLTFGTGAFGAPSAGSSFENGVSMIQLSTDTAPSQVPFSVKPLTGEQTPVNIAPRFVVTTSVPSHIDGDESGPVNGSFTVRQSVRSTTDTVVSYSISGTATSGSDFSPLTGTVTIPAGSQSAVISVSVLDDTTVEGTETIQLTLTGITSSNPGITLHASAKTDTINILDNVGQSLVVSSNSISVNEGSTNTFTVRLAEQPAADVTVNVARASGDTDLSVNGGGTLTFTSANWNTPQTVTVAAAEDADFANGSTVMNVTSSGLTTVGVTATEVDNDAQAIVVSSSSVAVNEGATNTFTVRLAAQPATNVTVNVARASGDADLSVSGGSTITFTPANWNSPQTVTLAAAEDVDLANGSALVNVTSSGLTTVGVTASEVDNDVQSLIVSSSSIAVNEGATNTFTVRLAFQPAGDVTVNVARASGDADLTVSGGGTLTFTSANWNTPQTVTLAAAEDLDTSGGSATMNVTSAGLTTAVVTVNEIDNDIQSLVVSSASVSVNEGATNTFTVRLAFQPTADVTVTVNHVSGDTDLAVSSGAMLTFTSANWNIPQTVTLAAVEDSDFANGSAVINVRSTGLTTVGVTANEVDNDVQSLVVSSSSVSVNEGSTNTFTVRLAFQPTANVTVNVTRASGDTDLSVTGGGTLTFTSANWNLPQTVTLAAAEDDGLTNSTAVFNVTSAGITTVGVTALEIDNDVQSLIV